MRFIASVIVVVLLAYSNAVALTPTEQRQSLTHFLEIPNPNGVIPKYDVNTIGSFLTELDIEWVNQDMAGTPIVVAEIYGLIVAFVPTKCREEPGFRCSDVQIISAFEGQTLPLDALNARNREHTFAYAGLDARGGLFVRRYDFEQTGILRKNFAASIAAFRIHVEEFYQAFRLTVENESPGTPGSSPAMTSFGGNTRPVFDEKQTKQSETSASKRNLPDLDQIVEELRRLPGFVNKIKQD